MCIRPETREKGGRSLAFSPVSKPHAHITYMLRQCTSIAYLSSANRTTRTVFYWASTFPCNNTQFVIDNASYIYYAEARILNHQNNAFAIYNDATNLCKWTTTPSGRMRNFGRIHLPKSTPINCII